MTLLDRHRHELEVDSAIAPELIAEREYRSVTATEAARLGFATYQCRDGMLIPLHDLLGSNSRYALKPNQPRLERRNGKPDRPIKYEYPAGQPPVLDVPPRCLAAIADANTPLLFTEGAKKADCAAGFPNRWCVINIWGVHNWYRNPEHGGFGTIEPIPDWEAITPTLDGRVCYLAFDSDGFTKDSVALALRRLANFLARRGALVYVVHLPDAEDGSKLGLDDFVAANGPDAFLQLVDDAEPWGSIGMVRRLQAEIRELRAQLSAQAELLRNPSMRERDKVVAIATINEAGWRKSLGTPTPFVVNRERIADAVGLKPDAVGQSLTRLSSEGGLFTKQVTRTWNEQGEARSVIKLAPRQDGGVVDLIRHAARFEPEYEGVRGGRHAQACPEHPGADLVRRVTLVCTDCGQLVHDRTETLKPQNDVSEMIDAAPIEQKPQTNGSAQVIDMLEHLERQVETATPHGFRDRRRSRSTCYCAAS